MRMDDDSPRVPAIISEYLDYLRGMGRIAPRTLEAYGDDLSKFAAYCENLGIDPKRPAGIRCRASSPTWARSETRRPA